MTQSKSPGSVVVGARIPRESRDAFCKIYGREGPSKGLSSVIDLVLASGCQNIDELAGRLSLAPSKSMRSDEVRNRFRLVVSEGSKRKTEPDEDA